MSSFRSAQAGPTANSAMPFNFPTPDAEVAAVLARFPVIVGMRRVIPLINHGGLSGARIWRVETADAAFALRQWPTEHPSPERLRFIHAVLAHVYACGLPIVPVPVPTRVGETFVTVNGRLWELAPWLPGEASFEREPSRAKIGAAMRTLAKFHLASASFDWDGGSQGGWGRSEAKPPAAPSFGPSPGLTDRGRRSEELDENAIRKLRQAIESYRINPAIDELARSIHASLSASIPAVRPILQAAIPLHLPLQPCLRDIWHGNLLFSSDEVTGIVDFGAMQIDSPALDVARLLGSMAGNDSEAWRHGLDTYEELRPLSPDERTAIRAADASGIVLGCVNWLTWLYVERREFGDIRTVEGRMRSLAARMPGLRMA